MPSTRLRVAVFLSGSAALIYQLLWMRELALVMGTSHTAVAVCLAVYMGGLALGAALAANFAEQIHRPVHTFVAVELAIAGGGLLMPAVLAAAAPLLPRLLAAPAGTPADAGAGQALFYGLTATVSMGLPALCIGATLPLLARLVAAADAGGMRGLSVLYAVNTAGAAAGAGAAGFLLIPSLGLSWSALLAAGLNVGAAALAWTLRSGTRQGPMAASPAGGEKPQGARRITPRASPMWATLAALVSVASFALEVLWARLFSHLLGGSTQGFALMLAATLAGLATGAALVRSVAPSAEAAARWIGPVLAVAALATTASFLLVAAQVSETLSAWPVSLLVGVAIFPGAAALGASFPLLISAARGNSGGLPRSTGLISASSTAGAIVGALGTGFFVLPHLGFERALAAICGLLTALAWGAHLAAGRRSFRAAWPAACAGIAVVALALHPPRPEALLASSVVDRAHPGEEIFFRVGRAATVQVQTRPEGFLLRSDGLPEAMIARRGAPPSIDDQQWLGALGPMARPEARSMLVVGFGGGVALEAVPAALERIDVVEIEPRIVEANRALAAVRRADPLADPRVRLVLNDARNSLLRTGLRYDVIVSQPSHPWTATSATLYSREFIALAKSRLKSHGVLVQWMNAAFLDEALFRALLATLRAEFRHVRAYEPVPRAFLLLAADAPLRPERWFGSPASDPGSRQRLAWAGLGGPQDLRWSLVLDERSVDAVAAGAEPLTDDRNPLTVRSRPAGGMDERRLDALLGDYDALAAVTDDAIRGKAAYLALRVRQVRPSRLVRAPTLAARATLESADFETAAREIAALADGSASAEARAAAARLAPSAAAVIAAWREGRQGRTAAIAALETDLAAAQYTDPWSATAARLRAEWRLAVALAMPGDDPQRAVHLRDALAIVERALASGVTTDLLFLRARLSASQDQLVESAAAFATELNRRLEDPFTRPVASGPHQVQRLEALRQALVPSGGQRAREVRGDIDRLALRLQGG